MQRRLKDERSWTARSKKKLDAGSYGDKILLSFKGEAQYHDFNKTYGRGKYTIDHILRDHQSGRFYVWITKK